jgi:hypothetical protein
LAKRFESGGAKRYADPGARGSESPRTIHSELNAAVVEMEAAGEESEGRNGKTRMEELEKHFQEEPLKSVDLTKLRRQRSQEEVAKTMEFR